MQLLFAKFASLDPGCQGKLSENCSSNTCFKFRKWRKNGAKDLWWQNESFGAKRPTHRRFLISVITWRGNDNFFNLFVWGKKRDREEITNRQATYFQAVSLLQNVLQLGEGEPGPGGILQVVHNLDTWARTYRVAGLSCPEAGVCLSAILGVSLMFLACLDHKWWAQFHLGILGQ